MGLYQNRHNNFKPDLSQTPQAQGQIWAFCAAAELQHSTNVSQWTHCMWLGQNKILKHCFFRFNTDEATLLQLFLTFTNNLIHREEDSSITSILAAHLADRRVNWRQLLFQMEPVWWATGMNGSLSRWLPWSAGKPPGSPAPRFPDFFHHCQVPARSWRPPPVLPHGSSDNLWKINA